MNILLFEIIFKKWQLIRNFALSFLVSAFLYYRYLPYENLAYDYLMIFGYLLFSYSLFQASKKLLEVFTGPVRFFYLGAVQKRIHAFTMTLLFSWIEFLLMYIPLLVFQCLAFSFLIQQNLLQIPISSVYSFGLLSLLQTSVLFITLVAFLFFVTIHSRFYSFMEASIWSGFVQYCSVALLLILVHFFLVDRFPIADIYSPVSLFNFSVIDGFLMVLFNIFLFYWLSVLFNRKMDFY
jgi:hypothetical protein